jgi:hypothetical protein
MDKQPVKKKFSLLAQKASTETQAQPILQKASLSQVVDEIIELSLSEEEIEFFKSKQTVPPNETDSPGEAVALVEQETKVETPARKRETKREAEKPAEERKISYRGRERLEEPKRKIYSVQQQGDDKRYACWNCCHCFEGAPVGIPEKKVEDLYYTYGNFCSYNCAKRYLCPETMDDYASWQSSLDYISNTEKSERLQLLEELYIKEYDLPATRCIKPAPKRLTLTLFGGPLSIEEYREAGSTPDTTFRVFKSPIVPIIYNIEETHDVSGTVASTKLDVDQVQQASKDIFKMAREKTKDRQTIQKFLMAGVKGSS